MYVTAVPLKPDELHLPQLLLDYASIVGAVATALAVLVALWLAIRDGRRARRQELRTIAIDEQAQAVQVGAWINVYRDASGADVANDILVRNGSDAPVYDVCVSLGYYNSTPGYHKGRTRNTAVGLVPPGTFAVPMPQEGYEAGRFPGLQNTLQAAVCFRDAAGLNWLRDASGILQCVPSVPPVFLGLPADERWSIAPIRVDRELS